MSFHRFFWAQMARIAAHIKSMPELDTSLAAWNTLIIFLRRTEWIRLFPAQGQAWRQGIFSVAASWFCHLYWRLKSRIILLHISILSFRDWYGKFMAQIVHFRSELVFLHMVKLLQKWALLDLDVVITLIAWVIVANVWETQKSIKCVNTELFVLVLHF